MAQLITTLGPKHAAELGLIPPHEHIQRILDAGLGDRLLLSHDRGWYDPALPAGGTPRPFTYLSETFLPKLRQAGVDDPTLRQLTQLNTFPGRHSTACLINNFTFD